MRVSATELKTSTRKKTKCTCKDNDSKSAEIFLFSNKTVMPSIPVTTKETENLKSHRRIFH
jgi:hypothetical protein